MYNLEFQAGPSGQINFKKPRLKMNTKTIAVLVSLTLALTAIALGQAPTKGSASIVYVPVNVTGPKTASVSGLKKENFILKEDGIEQTISAFYEENQPIDIDLILAMEGLEKGRSDLVSAKIREAIENFRHQSNSLNKWVVEEMPFGANGVFDAMSRHVTRLAENSINPRKLVLVLTDSFENSGGEPGRALQEYAKKLDVPIYIIYTAFQETIPGSSAFGNNGRGNGPGGLSEDILEVARGNRIYLSAGAVYEDLTKFTGGRLFQAEADTALPQFLEVLAAELKGQYVLGFKSTNDARDDKWRKLEIKIKAPNGVGGIKEKDMKVKARDRYFVAKVSK
jgi:Ca-activated chloride channel family protein